MSKIEEKIENKKKYIYFKTTALAYVPAVICVVVIIILFIIKAIRTIYIYFSN